MATIIQAGRLADHALQFSDYLTFAGCCRDTVPMSQLIDVRFFY
jgi:hypothetical protein